VLGEDSPEVHARSDDALPAGPVIELTGVRKSYLSDGPPVRALRGVDLVMERGEFVAVMGPSGHGLWRGSPT
jgi:ABC-type glutathione transport system ATPase component